MAADTRAQVEAIVAALPLYPSLRDLLDAFGSRDALLDAYVQGWIPADRCEVLEADYPRLLCWLAVRAFRFLRDEGGLP